MQELFGVELFKGETRTDWLRRPLSAAQLSYAAEDVAYLLPIYQRLRDRLQELGRFEWALEDSASLLDPRRYDSDPERAVLRLRAAARFNRRQHAAARELLGWREIEARRRDLPRSFVLKDELLVQLASRQPVLLRDLQRLPAYDERQGAATAAIGSKSSSGSRRFPRTSCRRSRGGPTKPCCAAPRAGCARSSVNAPPRSAWSPRYSPRGAT